MLEALKRHKDFWLDFLGIERPPPLVDLTEAEAELKVVDYDSRSQLWPVWGDVSYEEEEGKFGPPPSSFVMKQVVSATRERIGGFITYTFKLGPGDDTHDGPTPFPKYGPDDIDLDEPLWLK